MKKVSNLSSVVSLAIVLCLAACSSGCSSGGSSSGGPAGGGGGSKMTAAKLQEAYFATFGDMKRTKDPYDVKLKELKAKLGAPHKTEGEEMFWYGAGTAVSTGPYCTEVKAKPSVKGALMNTVDKAKCGL